MKSSLLGVGYILKLSGCDEFVSLKLCLVNLAGTTGSLLQLLVLSFGTERAANGFDSL
jgi:hypothetical protein